MNEKFGIDVMKGFTNGLGHLIAIGYGVFVDHEGLLPLIFSSDLKDVIKEGQSFFTKEKLSAAKSEILDMSKEEYVIVKNALLSPMPKPLQDKLRPYDNLLETCIDTAIDVVTKEKLVYAEILSVVEKFKVTFGI